MSKFKTLKDRGHRCGRREMPTLKHLNTGTGESSWFTTTCRDVRAGLPSTTIGTPHEELRGVSLHFRLNILACHLGGRDAWKPVDRARHVSPALRAYAAMTTSADTGAVRDVSQVER